MSLSRPATFPLLKLPFLCIKPVITSWDIFDIIFFALISQKTRRIVKILKIPMSGIQIFVSDPTRIWLGGFSRIWIFSKPTLKPSFYQYSMKTPLMLRNHSIPLNTRRMDRSLESDTDGKEMICLQMVMEFLNEVFNCSVEVVDINMDNYPESGDIGVKYTVNLNIHFGYAQSRKLKFLLENLEVTGTCDFLTTNKESNFFLDPKLFKCKKLIFSSGSATWVTREILLQFEVAQFKFYGCLFSEEDILSFVTNWFHSNNRKLEYLFVLLQSTRISLKSFQTEKLNPVPLSGRARIPQSESLAGFDFSKGLEIVRHDGLEATIHVTGRYFLFYVWNNQPAITQH